MKVGLQSLVVASINLCHQQIKDYIFYADGERSPLKGLDNLSRQLNMWRKGHRAGDSM
jgi:hypothetical protein